MKLKQMKIKKVDPAWGKGREGSIDTCPVSVQDKNRNSLKLAVQGINMKL